MASIRIRVANKNNFSHCLLSVYGKSSVNILLDTSFWLAQRKKKNRTFNKHLPANVSIKHTLLIEIKIQFCYHCTHVKQAELFSYKLLMTNVSKMSNQCNISEENACSSNWLWLIFMCLVVRTATKNNTLEWLQDKEPAKH